MNLKEPKKKRRVYVRPETPFPLTLNKEGEWPMYTAHLGITGACVAHPDEILAIYSMGAFGKGSLSRGFPQFGKRKYGAPPLIRERQWKRRKSWLECLKKLEADSSSVTTSTDQSNKPSTSQEDQNQESSDESAEEIIPSVDETEISTEAPRVSTISDDISLIENDERTSANESPITVASQEIDEIVLDSTEDEEICEIVYDVDDTSEKNDSDEVCVLEDENEKTFGSDSLLDISESSTVNKEEVNMNEVLVLPDSDPEDLDNYLNNVKPRIETEGFPMNETLQLSSEETFFLMYGLGCLQLINYDDNPFTIVDAWNHFNKQDKNFVFKYIVYHYFRSKGWVVKPGIKFGGEFILYKQGPAHYHASYVVIIEVADADTLMKNRKKTIRHLTWTKIRGLIRLAESAAKEVLIAQVLWPASISCNVDIVPLPALGEFTVRETLLRRWNPRQTKDDGFDEEDTCGNEDSS